MSTAPIAFTGISTYSSDFQSILARNVGIAKLPLTRLQNSQAAILSKKADLVAFSSPIASLASSISALGQLGSSKGLVATSSDSTKVTVVNTGSSTPSTYTLSNITSIATPASESSLTGYADSAASAVSSGGNLSLQLGSKSYSIHLASGKNNLVGLRDAINNLGAGVTASILTTGTGANPNYLTISADASGATSLRLNDVPAAGPPVNLITASNQGTNAVFQLNGVGVSRSSNTVNDVVAGVTFNILGTTGTGQNVTISTATDRTQLSAALQDFASKYNAVVDQVDSQVGTAAGSLAGDFVLRQLQSDLHDATSCIGTGSSSIRGLANLGIVLDSSGKASFDQNTFNSLSSTNISDAFAFLGSATSGFGSLAAKFTQLSDPTLGLIKAEEDGLDRSNTTLTNQINATQDRITTLTNSLTLQLETADAAVAKLQTQQTQVTAAVQSVDLALYGQNFGSATAVG